LDGSGLSEALPPHFIHHIVREVPLFKELIGEGHSSALDSHLFAVAILLYVIG